MTGLKKFDQLKKVLNSYSGGAVPFEDFKYFEKIKPKTPVLYHLGKFEDGKVIVMYIPNKK